jgi:hypothetical protein
MNLLGNKVLHLMKLGIFFLAVALVLALPLAASQIPQGDGQQAEPSDIGEHILPAKFSSDTRLQFTGRAENECISQQSPSQNNPTQEQSPPTQSTKPQEPGQSKEPAQGGEKPEKDDEVKITPREAEELFHSVDEILEFDSKQTGLPIRKQVKRRLTSRDEVVSYLTKHMNDEDTQRLRRSELVLKKFGLLPRDFDLEKLLVALLREQVAGYYDPKTKTVNLLDWVPVEQQEPVMAHELTHALQDQTVNLDRWMKKGDKDLAEIHKDITPADIENDEIDDAREAVVEGQAEAVMLQYALAPVGRSIVDSPELVESMESEMDNGSADSKVFKEAPIFLKESLTFPYNYGLAFVVKLMQKGGREKAFADVLHDPPHTTRQIMEPETYMAGERIEPMRVPEFKRDFKDYEKFDIGAMGEFDVAVLVEQYAGKQWSKRIYPEWRGGYYYAARPKNNANGPLGLLYVSRWSNAEKAGEFADIYARSLKDRYTKAVELDGSGDSLAVNADESRQAAPEPAAASQSRSDQSRSDQSGSSSDSDQPKQEKEGFKVNVLKGRHVWQTNEGTVVIEEQGDTVFISETLDAATTMTLEKEVFAK